MVNWSEDMLRPYSQLIITIVVLLLLIYFLIAGNGRWAVSLRCAELSEDRCTARLVAGGGIVADSDPRSELSETQAKFQAMLSAIVRP